jgi:hypothetical protein
VNAFWYLEPSQLYAGEELEKQLASEIEALQTEKRYQGRTLTGIDFRSFDRQSEGLAVVTARVTWRDALYEFQGDWPSYAEEAIARRGPYTRDVTYVLERDEQGRWRVTRGTYLNGLPEWQ